MVRPSYSAEKSPEKGCGEGAGLLGASTARIRPSQIHHPSVVPWRGSLRKGGCEQAQPDAALPFARRRGVGCIHYEMATGRPLFPGSTVKEELHLIFRLLGQSPDAPSSPPGGAGTLPSLGAERGSRRLSTARGPVVRASLCPHLLRAPSSRPWPRPLTMSPPPPPLSPGTPTEETWPGVTALSEFRAYNFPRYLPQPLLSHAPR